MYSLVRKIAGFWDEVTSLWEAKELPLDFWGGEPGSGKHVWLQRANNHRMYQEAFDIANYYRLNFDEIGKKPYSMSRPTRFWIIQKEWVKWGLACRDSSMKIPKCFSTLGGWAKDLRSMRTHSPLQLPHELSSKPCVKVTLQQLSAELELQGEKAPVAPQEGAQGAAVSGAGDGGAEPPASTAVSTGNGNAQHTAHEHV